MKNENIFRILDKLSNVFHFSNMREEQFKTTVLTLFFYNFVSKKEENLISQSKNTNETYIREKLGYYIKNEYLYSSVTNIPDENLSECIKSALCDFLQNNSYSNISCYVYDTLSNDSKAIPQIVRYISECDIDIDSFYVVWEYLLEKFNRTQRTYQDDYTPQSISELIAKIANIYVPNKQSIKICDHLCGSATLIAKVYQTINQTNKDIYCEASDISAHNSALAQMTMIINNIDTSVNNKDALLMMDSIHSDADIVISQPTFSIRWNRKDIDKNDIRFEKYGLPDTNSADYLFLMHNLFCTDQKGTTILLMNYSKISTPNPLEKEIQKKLINNNNIEAIIKLPSDLMANTSINTCIIVLKHKRNNNNIFMIDASKCAKSEFGKNILTDIDKIVETLKNKKEIRDFSKSISQAKIEKNLYSLNIPLYIDSIVDMIKLNDLADLASYVDIYFPTSSRKNTCKVLTAKNFKYPIDFEKLEEGCGCDINIKKGDTLLSLIGNHTAFYINEEPKENVSFSPSSFCLLRLKENALNIVPEYICMYINSEMNKKIMNIYSDGSLIKRLKKEDLEKLKIIIPNKPKEYYSAMFNYQISSMNYDKKVFDPTKDMPDDKSIEAMFIIEQIQKISSNRDNRLKEIFEDDLLEVKQCINAKAYKAALVLCGSILEAFLLDWLNILDPRGNWINGYDDNDERYKLSNYIKQIRNLKKPSWLAVDQAHTIRRKRNLVHAALCLHDDTEINEDLCIEVLGYLKYVLDTRWD